MPKPEPLWVVADIKEHDTADVYLNEHGKYKDIQTARDIHYTDERNDYPSDEVFANFRNFRMGTMKENILYRSASPCDNQHNRAPYVDQLIEEAGVKFILNLSDNDVKIERYLSADDFSSPYFRSLYDAGNVEAIALNMNYQSEEFAQKIVQGFNAMAESEGPYLVHCTEGKDRAGFTVAVLEALMGASAEEIIADYMVTYYNYYGVQPGTEQYDVIAASNIQKSLAAAFDMDSVFEGDLQTAAVNYLTSIGLTAEEIAAVQANLGQ